MARPTNFAYLVEIKALIFVNDKNIKKTQNFSCNILNYYHCNIYFVSLLKSSLFLY